MEATIFNILRNFSLHHLPNLALELSLQNAMVPCAVNQIKQMQQDLFIWAEIFCVFSKFHLPLAFLQFLSFFSSLIYFIDFLFCTQQFLFPINHLLFFFPRVVPITNLGLFVTFCIGTSFQPIHSTAIFSCVSVNRIPYTVYIFLFF